MYLFVVFLSAFLLFQVQPVIAKVILPLFGGGAAVWSACLLFFQTFLLFGYLYAHGLTKLMTPKKQLFVHCSLLGVSLLLLPFGQVDIQPVSAADEPLTAILMMLLFSIGLPYFLLSATGPLVQRWFSYAEHNKSPYKLYSLSNIGSLFALVSYPFIIEPELAMDKQLLVWSLAYCALVVGFIMLAKNLCAKVEFEQTCGEQQQSLTGSGGVSLLWLLLGATGVVLLISTTNAMTQNIPPMPFLWVLPLCIYLLTFIISFQNARWYVRWYWFAIFLFSSVVSVLMFFIGTQFDISSQIGMYSLILLSACMICHGELAKLKPSTDKLTLYYLFISLGGALGSLFVSYLCTLIFDQFYEFPLAVFMVFVLFYFCLNVEQRSQGEQKDGPDQMLMGFSTNSLLKVSNVVGLCVVGLMFYVLEGLYRQYDVDSSRNFYGVLAVKDVNIEGQIQRRLIDGTTSHGTQSLAIDKAMEPLSYYRQNTGGALALQYFSPAKPVNAAFIGLGAGALAAYGRVNDSYHFYELNPAVYEMAQKHFSFLSQSKADVKVTLGDGRVNLQQTLQNHGTHQFDLLVLDAFSGDSIPTHLLTREAFELYWQVLKTEGVLAIHISNSHLDLTPLVRGLVDDRNDSPYGLKLTARYFNYRAMGSESHDAQWVLISNNKRFNQHSFVNAFQTPWPADSENTIVWTDNYSNLFSVLKF